MLVYQTFIREISFLPAIVIGRAVELLLCSLEIPVSEESVVGVASTYWHIILEDIVTKVLLASIVARRFTGELMRGINRSFIRGFYAVSTEALLECHCAAVSSLISVDFKVFRRPH